MQLAENIFCLIKSVHETKPVGKELKGREIPYIFLSAKSTNVGNFSADGLFTVAAAAPSWDLIKSSKGNNNLMAEKGKRRK